MDGGDEVKAIDIAGLTGVDLERRYNPNWPSQPRVPAGSGEESGRWTDGGATGGEGTSEAESAERPIQLASNDDGLSKIPIDRPPSQSGRWRVVKQVLAWLVRTGLRESPYGTLLDLIEIGSWVYDYSPYLVAYFDAPKTLDELRAAAETPTKGYDRHHIVERTPALDDDLDPSRIGGRENLILVPTMKHWEITAWYATRNKEYRGLSPREYVRGRDFDERLKFGLDVLRDFGVLKP